MSADDARKPINVKGRLVTADLVAVHVHVWTPRYERGCAHWSITMSEILINPLTVSRPLRLLTFRLRLFLLTSVPAKLREVFKLTGRCRGARRAAPLAFWPFEFNDLRTEGTMPAGNPWAAGTQLKSTT